MCLGAVAVLAGGWHTGTDSDTVAVVSGHGHAGAVAAASAVVTRRRWATGKLVVMSTADQSRQRRVVAFAGLILAR